MQAFFIADTHLFHENIVKFTLEDDKPLRPFSTIEEMHQTMEERWNETVPTSARVYVLGDVCMGPHRNLDFFDRLNGKKVLIRGNHDIFKLSQYSRVFKDIRGAHQLNSGILMTHIPIHPNCIGRWKVNVHGHLHSLSIPDSRYICVSAEQTNYRPVSVEEIWQMQKKKSEELG